MTLNLPQTHLLKFGFCLLFALASTIVLSAQDRTVTGTVTDAENGDPLIGVSVAVVGHDGVGAITDFDGNYSVLVPDGATSLQFSYVGYATQIVDITGDVIDVKMSGGEMLEEVVVIGYGTQKQKEVTSAVTNVKKEDFNQGNIDNPMGLLQGKVAGLTITKAGADPNGGFDVRLRGLNTFGANSQPLIVIDGVPNASLETVDPLDIESMDVLKDASASAIYGSRGSNGVILITTKKGSGNIKKVEYNGYLTSESVDNTVSVLSRDEYLNIGGAVQDFGTSTDWFDEITRTAVSQAHNLSFSGGNRESNYRLALNYREGQGVAIDNGFQSVNARLTLQQKALNNKMTLTGNVVTTIRDETYFPTEAFGFATRFNPTAPVRADDDLSAEWGGYFQRDAFGFFNPVAAAEQSDLSGKKNRILGSAQVEYEFIKGLTGSVKYTLRQDDSGFDTYWSKNAFYTPFASKSHRGWARKESQSLRYQQFEGLARYSKVVNKLDFEVLGGYNWEETTYSSFSALNSGFISDDFGVNSLQSGEDLLTGEAEINSFSTTNRLISFFGRAKFNYDDTYFLTFNVRREGSSKFGENNRWGTFPGISGGVNVSNLVKVPGFDRLKVRAGWGQTGNIPGGDFDYLLTYGPQTSGRFFLNGEYVTPFRPVRNANPDLKWETKEELNIGVDMNFFDYALGFSVDYYKVNVNDLILNSLVRVPPNLTDRKVLNLGEMENSGLEFALSWTGVNTQSGFSWVPSVTFTKFFDTKINSITSPETTGDGTIDKGDLGAPFLTGITSVEVREGQRLGDLIGPVFTGINGDTGEMEYQDADGDGIIDTEVLGNGLPTFQFGFSNTFKFKQFDLNFFLRGVFGHDLLNVNNAKFGVPASIAIQNGTTQATEFIGVTNGPIYSSVHVENASFITLDNASLGYTFDLKSNTINKLRVYITGQNLFTITDYSGVSPEVRFTDNGDPLAPGIDRENTYLRTRQISFGVNLGF